MSTDANPRDWTEPMRGDPDVEDALNDACAEDGERVSSTQPRTWTIWRFVDGPWHLDCPHSPLPPSDAMPQEVQRVEVIEREPVQAEIEGLRVELEALRREVNRLTRIRLVAEDMAREANARAEAAEARSDSLEELIGAARALLANFTDSTLDERITERLRAALDRLSTTGGE